MSNIFRQTVLSDGDLTIIIQNTFERPEGQTDGPFSKEVWNVTMVSPHFDSGIYSKEIAESYEAGLEAAWNQFNEDFGCEYTREKLEQRIKRIDF